MKLKKFQRKYEAKNYVGKIETDLYEISLDVQELKKELELIIDLYQQGEAKSEDAQEVVNLAESALVGANNFLWHMTEKECSANQGGNEEMKK